jgi:hypothetical protein
MQMAEWIQQGAPLETEWAASGGWNSVEMVLRVAESIQPLVESTIASKK